MGGTSLAVGAGNNYLFETGWGTTRSRWDGSTWSPTPPGTWIYGSGGGVSQIFAEPSYQQGVVPAAVFTAQGRTGRAVPDISAVGDPNTGYLVGQTQTFPDGTAKYSEYRIGGTSLSSPLIAGIMALANQAAGKTLGFVNPLLYGNAGSSAYNDVVAPASTVAAVRDDYANQVDASGGIATSLRTMNQTLSLNTTPGLGRRIRTGCSVHSGHRGTRRDKIQTGSSVDRPGVSVGSLRVRQAAALKRSRSAIAGGRGTGTLPLHLVVRFRLRSLLAVLLRAGVLGVAPVAGLA